MTPSPREVFWTHRGLWLVLALAAAMCGWLAWQNPNIGGDSMQCLMPFHSLAAGQGYTVRGEAELESPPGFGLIAFAIYQICRDIEYSGMLTAALSYLGIICVMYLWVWRGVRSLPAAGLTALWVALAPMLLTYSFINYTDVAAAFFYVAALCCFGLQMRDGLSWGRSALLGFFLGYGSLVRGDLSVLLPLSGAMLFLRGGWICRQAGWKQWWTGWLLPLLVLVVFFGVTVFPYALYLHSHVGRWTISLKLGLAMLGGKDTAANWTPTSVPNPLMHVLQNLPVTLGRMQKHAWPFIYKLATFNWHAWVPVLGVCLLYPFLGKQKLAPALWRENKARWFWLANLAFLIPLVPGLMMYPHDRYTLGYFSVVISMLAFAVVVGVQGIWPAPAWRTVLSVVIFLSLLAPPLTAAFVDLPTVPAVFRYQHPHRGLRAAGQWLGQTEPDADQHRVLCRKGTVLLFYAAHKRGPQGVFNGPPEFPDAVAPLLKSGEYRYLVLDSHYIESMPPYHELWSDPSCASRHGLALLHAAPGLFQVYGLAGAE